jgi:hypothetical protein
MRVIPADKFASAVKGAVMPHGFWQQLARMLDDYLVDRAKRTLPAAVFRRSRHEIEICRRLMLKDSLIARRHALDVGAVVHAGVAIRP